MSTIHGLQCNGCPARLIFTRDLGGHRPPTKAQIEIIARREGWNAPDKLGRHWCSICRKRDTN